MLLAQPFCQTTCRFKAYVHLKVALGVMSASSQLFDAVLPGVAASSSQLCSGHDMCSFATEIKRELVDVCARLCYTLLGVIANPSETRDQLNVLARLYQFDQLIARLDVKLSEVIAAPGGLIDQRSFQGFLF